MMRIASIEASQRSVDMQYFSTQEDTTGKLMLEAVLRAADRGVHVRMLLDDWNLDDFRAGAVSLDANPNIEIRIFNPYATRDEGLFTPIGNALSDVDQFTRRMHNKALIVDNQISIMGGRNLGDEYFGADKDLNFRDIDIFAVGPITRQLSSNFDTYWNSEQSFPIADLKSPLPDPETVENLRYLMKAHWQEMLKSPLGKKLTSLPMPHGVKNGSVSLIWAQAELEADAPAKLDQPPDTTRSVPGTRIEQLANQAHTEFVIFTPYFVPLDNGVTWLNSLVANGISVRIVTNSLSSTDMVPAEAAYSHYRESLVLGGVELYEVKSSQPKASFRGMFKPSSQYGLHSKIYMIDRKFLILGSFNFDPRSISFNTEQVMLINSPELCAQITRIFDEVTSPAASYHVVPTTTLPESDRPEVSMGNLAWVTQEGGKTVTYDFSPHTGFWRRAMDALFSLLPLDRNL
jgi:putative cardiolipin synthase